MKRNIIPLYCMMAWFFISCKKPGCLGNAGEMSAVSITLTPFNKLVLEDNVNLVLTQSTEEKMIVKAPENIIPNITGSISGQILTISNGTDCRWARDPGEKITVHLFFKELTAINYRGSGHITNTDTLKLDALKIETSVGAGDITLTLDNRYTGTYIYQENAHIMLHGKSEICYTYTNSRGITDMLDFRTKKMVIEYGGLSDTYVNVSDSLDGIIYHMGNVYYKGNPVITRSLSYSSGRLIRTP
jgi:hypothetical protein